MEQLKRLKENWAIVISLISILAYAFTFGHRLLNQYNSINKTIETTQQMSLKSVIWNENIPLGERASACDVYLSAGYNSLTKKECEIIIIKASENGLFGE